MLDFTTVTGGTKDRLTGQGQVDVGGGRWLLAGGHTGASMCVMGANERADYGIDQVAIQRERE